MPRHHLFGLSIESAIPLPDLPVSTVTPSTAADVTIACGNVPPPAGHEPTGLSITPAGAILNIPEAGRYLIANGTSIIVDPSPTASERTVRLYLLGSAFGAILHQRRLVPLHANIVEIGGAAVAFAGHSGAGKSTLAGWFHDRGFAILGDDVCVVRDGDRGIAVVEPGLPRIRLWQDALQASGRRASDYTASFDDLDKYDVPIVATTTDGPLPLLAVYMLNVAAPERSGSIVRLRGIDAVEALVANTYRGGYLALMGGVADHLSQCLSLASRVPVFEAWRQWGHDRFSDEAGKILAHVEGMMADASRPGHRQPPSA